MTLINDVTGLNPIKVNRILTPHNIDEIQNEIKNHRDAISIGGGRFSMGGQIGTEDSLHIDMRKLNQILEFNPEKKYIRVQAGIRWRDIQEFIDQHDLSIMIMQTYSNFTVGGSLNVNSHGRYIGQGPLILSVKSFRIVLADGTLIEATPTLHAEIFYAAIGGYGGLGVIVEVTLQLVDNAKLERQQKKLRTTEYRQYFFDHIRNNNNAVFHNADLYPPHYQTTRAISWVTTDKPVTVKHRLYKNKKSYAVERYFVWTITTTLSGKWRREHFFDPAIYLFSKTAWRNFEAGNYDVAELEPRSRKRNTYVLQEYFIPVMRFDEFMPKMAEILKRYRVNVLNISVRHAKADPGSLLAWAREEVFAFVLYYKQGTDTLAKNKVAIWTRELIDAALAVNGTYYLPYQPHATHEQFHQAYPHARKFFAVKKQLDPQNKFRNKLWDKYYCSHAETYEIDSEFKTIFNDTVWRDKFYLFLQNVYSIYPENAFHLLIQEACKKYDNDKDIYDDIQKNLKSIKPFLADLRFTIPALVTQKKEMAKQTAQLLQNKKIINGYLEIGTSGRYVNALKKYFDIKESIYLMPEISLPTFSPIDIAERGQIKKIGKTFLLNDYEPISENNIKTESLDLVTCYIGLHHAPLHKLDDFVKSIHRVLRKGASFIIRDHDAYDKKMHTFVSLVHAVFNAGLHISWENNCKELRHFTPLNQLISYLEARGFKYSGKQLYQAHDPSLNALMEFIKI